MPVNKSSLLASAFPAPANDSVVELGLLPLELGLLPEMVVSLEPELSEEPDFPEEVEPLESEPSEVELPEGVALSREVESPVAPLDGETLAGASFASAA